MDLYKTDKIRCGALPAYQYWLRKLQSSPNQKRWASVNALYRLFYKITSLLYCSDISYRAEIGPGLYIGHPYGITINPHAKIGKNCNIHKGATIGQENRGRRKGAPIIGDSVWIGINSTIVGKVAIGNDVLIAPNTYVNCDIPSHSIVFGNPCTIKEVENATYNYINHPYSTIPTTSNES